MLKDVNVVNEGEVKVLDVLIKGHHFEQISGNISPGKKNIQEIDGQGLHLFPGIIDTHVHFREPGLTHKADIATESKAALAGGVTSFLEMPNTNPLTTSTQRAKEKYNLAASKSVANYGFYIGASYKNYKELGKLTADDTCGVKIFQGSSTGNMLVNDPEVIDHILRNVDLPIAVHSEDEAVIADNLEIVKNNYPEPWPHKVHAEIRNTRACFEASKQITDLARKRNARLHVLHLTTARELELFDKNIPVSDKKVTTEVCPHHLYFDEGDYEKFGGLIKCNPAIKTKMDRMGLIEGLKNGTIDFVSSDHAPHLATEKDADYKNCPAGIPNIQHGLHILMDLWSQGILTLPDIAEKMAHNQAQVYQIQNRGFIREGYYADAFLLDTQQQSTVSRDTIEYKCGWSPLEGQNFPGKITKVWVNGTLSRDAGKFTGESTAMPVRNS